MPGNHQINKKYPTSKGMSVDSNEDGGRTFLLEWQLEES